jgi:hypothetical protein
MKQLGAGAGAAFSNKLIGQLGFIRKHRRYPFNRRTLLPFLSVIGIVPGLLALAAALYIHPPNNRSSAIFIPVLFICMSFPAIAAAVRYWRSLRFTSVAALPDQAGNMQLLERFLRDSRFAYNRHPDAPEVYAIVSTPIRAMDGEREVVIFIADAGRILINSHFTQNRFRAFIGQVRYMELARNLRAWIRQQHQPDEYALQRARTMN